MLVGHHKNFDTYQDEKGYTYIYRGNSRKDFDEFITNIQTGKVISGKEYDDIIRKHLKKHKR